MFDLTAAMILLSSAVGVLTQEMATCDGFHQPDWDDCATIAGTFAEMVGVVPNLYPECTVLYYAADGVDPDSFNCRIGVCPQSAETEISYAQAQIGYSTVRSVCETYDAGGEDVYEDIFTVQVYDNPDWEQLAQPLKEMDKEAIDRRHARDFAAKRQQPEDDGFNLRVVQRNVELQGAEQAMTGRLSAGSTYTTTETDSVSTGVSASVEVSVGFFEIFETSVGAEISQDQTSSSAIGIDVLVDCESGQKGIVYWSPLYTLYQGEFTPSGDDVNIYIPEDSASGRSNFNVRCLG